MNRDEYLRILVELQAFRVCPLIRASELMKEMKACGNSTSLELLERFEGLGWERPLAHIRYPKLTSKVIPVEGQPNHVQTEPLGDDEDWEGRTRAEYVRPPWQWRDMDSWLSEGFMRSSAEPASLKWDDYREGGRETGAPYYSRFQLYDLAEEIRSTTLNDNAAWIPASRTDAGFDAWAKGRTDWSKAMRAARQSDQSFVLGASEVCQAIASRYFFHTQTDGRVIRTTGSDSMWDWHRYCRDWEPKSVAERLGIAAADVRRLQERVKFDASQSDPLADWYDLVQFVSIDRKNELRGAARYAQLLYSMEHMLRLFYRGLTGEDLVPGRPHPEWTIDGTAEKQRHGEPQYLRFVSNRYGLNPQPKLVFYVEGEGEARVLPWLARERFGASLEHYGIVLRSLGSVSEFPGSKAEKKYGALRRSIEELHDLQIITFVLLDNEDQRIQAVKERLCSSPSSYRPGRTITRDELIFVWNKSIEFDNFRNDEIAEAMTEVADGRFPFSNEDVASARAAFGQRGDPLTALYREKMDYGLRKPELLDRLFGNLPVDREPRPIDIVLDRVLEFAALNHQPTMAYTEKLNQATGMLGHPVGGASSNGIDTRLRNSIESGFEPLRELQDRLRGADAGKV